uniref:Uncharacterized protein n=1 Tax=Crocodylus porosus TaxID=8502 RepID=A0A7M4F994_CROPO
MRHERACTRQLRGKAGGQAASVQADLSQLSEAERRQIAAVLSRAQGLPGAEPPPLPRHPEHDINHYPRQAGKPPDPGPSTLSKSRTVDVLKTEQRLPGSSPSSTSLRESKSRTDFKEDQKPSMMPSFLSEANPLSAVTSVVNKFNPFDLISESDAAQEEANRKQKVFQKDQGKPEEQKGPAKHPAQQQPPKPVVQPHGPVKPISQQVGPSKPAPQQQQPGAVKQAQKPGPVQPAGRQSEEAKPPSQLRGPPKSQTQQSEPMLPASQQQSPAKPAPQQLGTTKPLPQQSDAARVSSQVPAPTKPLSQQPGPGKQAFQPPGQQTGAAKPSPHQTEPAKQPSQQPAPAKPSPQATGPTKQSLQQPGSGKSFPQQTEPMKQPPQQMGPSKPPSQQPGKAPSQQLGPTRPSGQQPGLAKPLPQKQATAAQPAESAPKKSFCPLSCLQNPSPQHHSLPALPPSSRAVSGKGRGRGRAALSCWLRFAALPELERGGGTEPPCLMGSPQVSWMGYWGELGWIQ